MVIDAIGIAAELNMIASIKYIVLCADKTAVSFYSRSPLSFQSMSSLDEIPREHYNLNGVPMFIKLR